MSLGFAVNIDIILNTKALILTTSKPGYIENDFLEQLIEFYDLEPRANSCQSVRKYNYHNYYGDYSITVYLTLAKYLHIIFTECNFIKCCLCFCIGSCVAHQNRKATDVLRGTAQQNGPSFESRDRSIGDF